MENIIFREKIKHLEPVMSNGILSWVQCALMPTLYVSSYISYMYVFREIESL